MSVETVTIDPVLHNTESAAESAAVACRHYLPAGWALRVHPCEVLLLDELLCTRYVVVSYDELGFRVGAI